jgi:ParB family chromosome partitioning protein
VGNNEWYTPLQYVEAARKVLGSIDLDPASCEEANRVIKATRYYTKEDNGLMQPWNFNGRPVRVWLNPPYGRVHPERKGSNQSLQRAFAEKLRREFAAGTVEEAILLSLGNPNSVWFQPFFDFLICFNKGTLHFGRPGGKRGTIGFPLAFVYLGSHEDRFKEIFSPFGRMVRAVDMHTPQPIARELW